MQAITLRALLYLTDTAGHYVTCLDDDRLGWYISDRVLPARDMQDCIRLLGTGLSSVLCDDERQIVMSHIFTIHNADKCRIAYVTITLEGLDGDDLYLHIVNFQMPHDKHPTVGRFAYGVEGSEVRCYEGRL